MYRMFLLDRDTKAIQRCSPAYFAITENRNTNHEYTKGNMFRHASVKYAPLEQLEDQLRANIRILRCTIHDLHGRLLHNSQLPSSARSTFLPRLLQRMMFLLVIALCTYRASAAQIDTVMNVGVSSIFGTITVSHDGRQFIALDLSVRHAVRTFADPFHPVGNVVTGTKPGYDDESVPVGFLSNGDVILDAGRAKSFLLRWSQSSSSVTQLAEGLNYPVMRTGSDVIVARIVTDSGDMWVHVELDPFRYTVMFPGLGQAEILGTGSHVVLRSDSEIFVYDTYMHQRVQTKLSPKDMYDLSSKVSELGISYSDSTSPCLLLISRERELIRRFRIGSNEELAPIAIPQQSCDPLMLWFNNSGDTIITMCGRGVSQSGVTLNVYAVVDNSLENLWSAEVEEQISGRDLTDAQWLGDGRFVVSTMAGSTLFGLDSSRGYSIAPRYPAIELFLGSNGSGVYVDGLYSRMYFDAATGSLNLIENITGGKVHAAGTDVVASLKTSNSAAWIVLQDITTDTRIRSVNLSLPPELFSPGLFNARSLRAISPDLHYAALVLNTDTIVVLDLNDTTRVLIDECPDCGDLTVDFASNNEELVVVGSVYGGVWDLRSMTNVLFHADLTKPWSSFTTAIGFNASGNVLLKPTSRSIAIFDREAQVIRLTRNFPVFVYNVAVIDDNTILCETQDSILILDSLLSTVGSASIFPQSGSTPISWNAKLRRIALQLYQSDLLILEYKGGVTTVENEDAAGLHGIPGTNNARHAFYDSFTISVPTEDVKSVHVIDMNGSDVTDWARATTLDERTVVESAQLLSGVYCVVDRISGWRAVVVLLK